MQFDLTSYSRNYVVSPSTSAASSLLFLVNRETKLKLLKYMYTYTVEISLELV